MRVVVFRRNGKSDYNDAVSRIRFELNGEAFEIKEDRNRDGLVLKGDEPFLIEPIASNFLVIRYKEVADE